jgi:ketosteroid isomerase-like protein
MRRINVVGLALVTLCLTIAPLASGQGENPPASTKESGQTSGRGMTAVEQTVKGSNVGAVEQQINALADQYIQAFKKADTGFMEKYFADKFSAIHSNGQLYSKAQAIDNVKSGTLKWETVDTRERKIYAYGDAAVVVGLASSTGIVGGKPYSGDYRTTQVWVKQNGGWEVVAFQSTRVPTATQ